ncbi:MAG: hypothetical protein AAF726_06210 [Planctomycetota bacterium]
MKFLLSSLVAAPLFVSAAEVPSPPERAERLHGCLEPVAPSVASATTYFLQWDDSLDGDLQRPFKQCVVQIQRIDGALTGRFVGNVLGEARTATFTGEAIGSDAEGGAATLWMLQQREPGYVCSYQLSPSVHDSWDGTWRDSKGRTGTVRLWPVPDVRFTSRTPSRVGGELVDHAIEALDLPLAPDGFPVVDAHLRWCPGLFVMGPLADLVVGPASRNLSGARMAAQRIVESSELERSLAQCAETAR